jgi:hypothetical protein
MDRVYPSPYPSLEYMTHETIVRPCGEIICKSREQESEGAREQEINGLGRGQRDCAMGESLTGSGVNPSGETVCDLTVRSLVKSAVHFVRSPAEWFLVGEAGTG